MLNNVKSYLIMSVLILSALSMVQNNAFASPQTDLGAANNYAILSGSVITNGVPGQAITGFTGHISTLSANFTYSGSPLGSDQTAIGTTSSPGTPLGDAHTALVNIGTWDGHTSTGLACTFTFANGTVDLSTDTTHGHIGQYTPGVYCIDGAASIGTAGINFNQTGTYVFKIDGALTSVTQSHVTLSHGAQASDIFWAPSDASLGANTSFQGTILSGPGAITLGANSDLNQGRLVSESAITIEGGVHIITIPGGITLSAIAITHSATKLSYTVGDTLDIAGLVVTGTFSDSTHGIVTPDTVTGFNSASPVTGQVLTIHVGSHTATYKINVVAAPLIPITIGTANNYAILSGAGPSTGVITNGVPSQFIAGNVGHNSTESAPFTFATGFSDVHSSAILGDTITIGTPIGDAHAARDFIGNVTFSGAHAVSASGLACTFDFANGAIDLSTDTTHGTIGVYTPGVYCIFGAPSIGTAGITLHGAGTFVFKSSGSLTTVTQSHVTLSSGAQASNVFWAPSDASLGANTSFQGTILSGPGAITLGADADLNQGRLVSESAITILGGTHTITAPGVAVVSLSSITITTPAIKLSYNVGDTLDIAGLVVTGIYSDGSTNIVTPSSVTGFNSASPVTGQVLTIHFGSQTTTYKINVVAVPIIPVPIGTASNYVILSGSGNAAGTITNGVHNQLVTGNVGVNGTLTDSFTFASGSLVTQKTILGNTTTLGTPIGDAHAARAYIGTYIGTTTTGLACTTIMGPGAIDLSTDITHGPIGVYTPGVYCVPAAVDIGTAGITLNGSGLYVFKMDGALNTVAASHVRLSHGANAFNVFWAPTAATLGANSFFNGTILAGSSAITTSANVAITGRLVSESAITIGGGINILSIPSTPDTTAPTVSITSPVNGTVITHTPFTISGTASDNISVDHVTISIDGTPMTVTGATNWSASSGSLSNAAHSITATSFDANGNSASQTIYVTVNTVIINTHGPVSITSTTGKGSVTSITDIGTFTSFTSVSESTLSTVGKPTGVTFPYGFFSFNISVPFGATVHVTQTYPAPIPAGAKYWKIESGVWTDSTSLSSISGNTVKLTLTDGGAGDSDGVINGVISDPSGISTPSTSSPSSTVDLGTASTFSILASTFTNTAAGVVVNGDLGYTTGPAVDPVLFGTLHIADSTYAQAGLAQGTALTALNGLNCTFTFPPGAIDLGSNAQFPTKVYPPGVYCIDGALNIGSGPITLSGAGNYIFRSTGALNTAANTQVTLSGADASKVFWTPGAATTLGANTIFVGTVIDDAGITIGHTTSWTGRALDFATTVTTGGVDIFIIPPTAIAQLVFHMSESPTPSGYHPSLGGATGQLFNDGLKINGKIIDISKFNNAVPQQALPLNKSVTIAVKQGLTRGSPFWQHAMIFMNFNGQDTKTGNADTWISIDKTDGVQIHDPNKFVTNVSVHNDFVPYGMTTTFTFTPIKKMADSNMIVRVWDNQLRQTDAYVNGAIMFGDAPTPVAPVQKPDWIKVYTNLKDVDNAVESAGFKKPLLFAHISTTSQVWLTPNTGHVLWFFDTKDAQVALVIYGADGNMVRGDAEQLIPISTATGKDASHAGNHLSSQNVDEMNAAKAQQELNAVQMMERLGIHP